MTNRQIYAPSDWTKKRKIGNKRISKSIKAKAVKEVENSAFFARRIGLELNLLMTIRHHDIDSLSPEERNIRRERDLNRIKQYARDNVFTTAFVWSRESDRGTGDGEHLHILIHVPSALRQNFMNVVIKWSSDVHIRDADYKCHELRSGKMGSGLRYILKNSPQAAWKTSRAKALGGPILGKRCGSSRNIDVKARELYHARSDNSSSIERRDVSNVQPHHT